MIFSFVHIEKYAKVKRNLRKLGFPSVREFTGDEIQEFCAGFTELNHRWGLTLSACGESRDLSAFGIQPGQCIYYDLMTKEFGNDPILMDFLHPDGLGQQTLTSRVESSDPTRRLKDPPGSGVHVIALSQKASGSTRRVYTGVFLLCDLIAIARHHKLRAVR